MSWSGYTMTKFNCDNFANQAIPQPPFKIPCVVAQRVQLNPDVTGPATADGEGLFEQVTIGWSFHSTSVKKRSLRSRLLALWRR